MSAPIILDIQSVLNFRQYADFVFQPNATNAPASWASSALPPGCSFDTGTGAITGPVTKPGIYNVALRAINADGASPEQIFTFGIEEVSRVAADPSIELFIDVVTRLVSLDGGSSPSDASVPLLHVKRGDRPLFHLRFVKKGVPLDLDIQTLRIAMKEFETEESLGFGATAAAFNKVGAGEDTFYELAPVIASERLNAALEDAADDADTVIVALTEIEWTEPDFAGALSAGVPRRNSTRTFRVAVHRDILPDT